MAQSDVVPSPPIARTEAPPRRLDWVGAVPFLLVHAAPLAAFYTGTKWQDWVVCVVLYWVRMFGVTGGSPRSLAHRSYPTSRAVQFSVARLAPSSSPKGALRWAGHGRDHPKLSD